MISARTITLNIRSRYCERTRNSLRPSAGHFAGTNQTDLPGLLRYPNGAGPSFTALTPPVSTALNES